MTLLSKSIPDIFHSCDLWILPTPTTEATKNHVFTSDIQVVDSFPNLYQTVAYDCEDSHIRRSSRSSCYSSSSQDSSPHRVKVVVPVLLTFLHSLDRDRLVSSGVIRPKPKKSSKKKKKNVNHNNRNHLLANMEIDSYQHRNLEDSTERNLWWNELDSIGVEHIFQDSQHMQLYFQSSCVILSESSQGNYDFSFNNSFTSSNIPTTTSSSTMTQPQAQEVAIVENLQVLSSMLVDSDDDIFTNHWNHSKKHDDDKEEEEEEESNPPKDHNNNNNNHEAMMKLKKKTKPCGILFHLEITLQVSDTMTTQEEHHSYYGHGPVKMHSSTRTHPRIALKIQSILVSHSHKTITTTYHDDTKQSIHTTMSRMKWEGGTNHSSSTSTNPSTNSRDGRYTFKKSKGESQEDHHDQDVYISLNALQFATAQEDNTSSYYYPHETWTVPSKSPPPTLLVDIVPAFYMTLQYMGGDDDKNSLSQGVTLVSLTIAHSNLHKEQVLVTNIALYPLHSHLVSPHETQSMTSITTTTTDNESTMNLEIIDMTKNVQWTFLSETAPSLPLILNPKDAFSTVLKIHATEIMARKQYTSPLSVCALVNRNNTLSDIHQVATLDTSRDWDGINTSSVIMTSKVKWTTAPTTIGPSDAFRFRMSTDESKYKVGALFHISFNITNLSLTSKDLMLIMAEGDKLKDDSTNIYVNDRETESANANAIHTVFSTATQQPIVSHGQNNTFSVWGLRDEKDDGSSSIMRKCCNQDILAVDTAILLGELDGQASTSIELRFIPLKEGTLKIPNFKLYDQRHGVWYDCIHSLHIVAIH